MTPEGYDNVKNEIIHVFNFDISSTDKIEKCIIYVVGKVLWANKIIPKEVSQKIVFDLRGQPLVFIDRAKKMKQNIVEKVSAMQRGVHLNIEILI